MPPLVPLVGTTLDSWLPSFWRLGSLEQPSVWLRPHKGEQIPHLRRRLGRGRLLLYFAIRSEARRIRHPDRSFRKQKTSLHLHLHCLTRVVQGEPRKQREQSQVHLNYAESRSRSTNVSAESWLVRALLSALTPFPFGRGGGRLHSRRRIFFAEAKV